MRDEMNWVPVEVVWDEQTRGEREPRGERDWETRVERAVVRPIQRDRRARPYRDDAADLIERTDERRRKGDTRPRRNKFHLDDFEDEDY